MIVIVIIMTAAKTVIITVLVVIRVVIKVIAIMMGQPRMASADTHCSVGPGLFHSSPSGEGIWDAPKGFRDLGFGDLGFRDLGV